jgi:DNA-binding winged helix-turn-helix (wHTH) protein/Tol biopolymer transport system component
MSQLTRQLGVARSYDFGPYRVDAANRLLLRAGEVVPLTSKVFDILLVFVRNSGRLLDKDEVMREVWPDTVVEEGNLTRNVSTLRKALGESPHEHQYIVTVPGRGYRFVARVREDESDGAALVVEERITARVIMEAEGEAGRVNEILDERARADSHGRTGLARSGEQAARETSVSLAAQTVTTKAAHSTLRKTARLTLHNPVLLGCAALSVLALAAFYFLSSRPKEAAPASRSRMTRLTTTGNSLMASVSPDGQYIGYVKQDGARQSLRVIQVATNSDVQIIAPADVDYRGLTFSPDSNYIYYVMLASAQPEATARRPALYQISLIGGAPRKVMGGVDSPISFSPDGTQFTFVREDAALGESALLISNPDGTKEKRLASRKLPDYFDYPAWSPDGRLIACTATGYTDPTRLAFFTVPGGRDVESAAAARTWKHIRNIGWLKDGGGLVLSVGDPERAAVQLWQLSYPEGSARRLTDDLNDNIGASLTADSGMLVTVQSSSFSSLWLAQAADDYRATQMTPDVGHYDRLNWTAENQLVYAAGANDRHDLWLVETNESQPRRLTFDYAGNTNLSVSPDGRHLIFVSGSNSNRGIWRADIDGSNPQRLRDGRGTADAQITPDNKWLIYTLAWAGKWSVLWKAPTDGGAAAPLNDAISTHPAISPDGKFIACFYLNGQADTQITPTSIAIIPLEGGQPAKIFNIATTVNQAAGLRWTTDGLALTYVDHRGGHANVFRQPIDGDSPQQLTDFTDEHIFSFAWSRDGQQLALARGVIVSDVVLLRDF